MGGLNSAVVGMPGWREPASGRIAGLLRHAVGDAQHVDVVALQQFRDTVAEGEFLAVDPGHEHGVGIWLRQSLHS
jgi:hypothetical protein